MSERMHPEDIQAMGVAVATLVEAKIAEAVDEMKDLVRQAVDAGHAGITRAAQVEETLSKHDRAIRRLWREQGLPEDDFPLRNTGT
jgi:hypothetical protein